MSRAVSAAAAPPCSEARSAPDDCVGPEALGSILDLDGAGTLAHIRAGRRTAWRVEAEQMVAATHWADLHRLPTPADDDESPTLGSLSRETVRLLGDGARGLERGDLVPARVLDTEGIDLLAEVTGPAR